MVVCFGWKNTQSPNWLDLFSPLKLLIGIVNKSIKLFDLCFNKLLLLMIKIIYKKKSYYNFSNFTNHTIE